MKRLLQVMTLALLVVQKTSSHEYVYPIALCGSQTSSVLVIHQNSTGKLGLFSWNAHSGALHCALPSYYCPAGLRVLPDATGVSFIDNDRVRVKFFSKRSALAYDFAYPLTYTTTIAWANNGIGYVNARYNGRYAFFQIKPYDIHTSAMHVIAHCSADYLYPQCCGNWLYYIERTRHATQAHYCMKKMQLPNDNASMESLSLDEKLECLLHEEEGVALVPHTSDMVYDFGGMPIIAMHMVNDRFGFVVTHQENSGLTFGCSIVQRIGQQWQCCYAFSFSLPQSLLFGECCQGRLYESLLPLLPCYIQGFLYFSTMNATGFLGIYRYAIESNTTQLMTDPTIRAHLFSPVDLGSTIVYGGSCDGTCQGAPVMTPSMLRLPTADKF